MNIISQNNFNKHNNPLVSVITVCLNAEKHLFNCIESVFNYGGNFCEHIIIDGQSSDQTVQIIKENKSKISFWISEKDNGIYNAMNKAINYALGKWILFLGSDDELNQSFKDIIPNLLEIDTVYYGDYISDGKKYGGKFSTYRLAKSNFCQQSVLYPINVFKKYSFNENYKISADHIFNIQCWTDSAYKFKYFPIPLTIFSSSGISSLKTDSLLETDRDKIILHYFGLLIYIRYKIKRFKNLLKINRR
jgi:glycosyltransferase involved in cell wall biosynthesis